MREEAQLWDSTVRIHTVYSVRRTTFYLCAQFMLLLAGQSQEAQNQHMTPKLANKVFSVKSTQIMRLEHHKESYNTSLRTRKQGI